MTHHLRFTSLLIVSIFTLGSFAYETPRPLMNLQGPTSSPQLLDDEFYCHVARELSPRNEKEDFSCNDEGHSDFLYFHVKENRISADQSTDTPNSIQIASFNLLHLGDDVGQLKNLTLVAELMNLWDVVAASELKSLPITGKIHQHNQDVLERPTNQSREYSLLILPGYYQLLGALRTLDSSWSLVLTRDPQGKGPYRELTGFYFRGSKVRLLADRAKLVKIDPYYQSLLLRTPSQIFLQSGSFRFSLVASHLRFTVPPDRDERKRTLALADEILSEEMKNLLYLPFVKKENYRLRFAELKSILRGLFGSISKELVDPNNKVILMGDFNLNSSKKRLALKNPHAGKAVDIELLWNELLNPFGKKLFIDQPTTISEKKGLLSSYDHFIANPDEVRECDFSHAKTWNFSSLFFENKSQVQRGKQKSADQRVKVMMEGFIEGLKKEGSAYFRSEGRKHRSFYGLTWDRIVQLANHSPILAGEFGGNNLEAKIQERIISLLKSQPSDSDYRRRFRAVYQVLSDHIPIVLRCRIDGIEGPWH